VPLGLPGERRNFNVSLFAALHDLSPCGT
jgi:hypothetical protein